MSQLQTSKLTYNETPGTNSYESPEEQYKEAQNRLAQAETELARNQTDRARVTTERDSFKAEVSRLAGVVQQIKQAAENFGKARQTLEATRQELESYFRVKRTMIEAVLGNEKKKVVDDLIKRYDDQTSEQLGVVKRLNSEADEARAAYAAAETKVGEAQKDYDEAKQYQSIVQAKLSNADLRKAIESLEDKKQGKWAESIYIHLTVMDQALRPDNKPIEIRSDEAQKKVLESAYHMLTVSRENALQKKKDWENAQRQAEDAKSENDTQYKQRTARLLELVASGNGTEPGKS